MIVTLTPADQRRATEAGESRFYRGSKQRYGHVEAEHTVELEIEATGAEIAVATAIGKPWEDAPDRDGDVGEGVQVRHARHEGERLLIQHPEDRDDHFFFLVTGTFPRFNVVGYLRGDKAKGLGEVEPRAGGPVVCVEQEHLQKLRADLPPAERPKPKPRGPAEPACAFRSAHSKVPPHGERDWRLPEGNAYSGGGGGWVCGVCHPPPFPDTFDVVDSMTGEIVGSVAVEWRGDVRAAA